jgi:hypothetical protein
MVIISATYCITLAYIYYHGIIDHSGITFKVSHSISPTKAVLRIRIHRIHMFFGLPNPDPLVRGMDPDPHPDPSMIMKK